jgi:thiol-disulfide isomerase/thioredoxin
VPSVKSPTWARRGGRLALEALAIVAVVLAVQFWQARGLADGSAPPLAGNLVDGGTASLTEALAAADGKPVLVAFWATWCGVCKAEASSLESLAAERPVVAIATSSGSAEEVRQYLAERGRKLPSIIDDEGRLAAQWHVQGLPTHFIVDRNGNIRFRMVGYTSSWGLRARLWWAEHQ